MTRIAFALQEWQTVAPKKGSPLWGFYLSTQGKEAAQGLAPKLEVCQLLDGVMISARSWVGRVSIGDIDVAIAPKIKGLPLLRLMRYAYDLSALTLLPESDQALSTLALTDLLVLQLHAEVRELWARGLHRRYEPNHAWLKSPKGRIDINALAKQKLHDALAVPCTFFPRLEDNPLNQLLLAGVTYAADMAGFLPLKADLRQMGTFMAETVSRKSLDDVLLAKAESLLTRLTAPYRPALALINLLYMGHGVTLDVGGTDHKARNFLFDMNMFYQALLQRFLQEHLPGYNVRAEQPLFGVMSYNPGLNPRHRQAPLPRPDFTIYEGSKRVAIIDSKYRDLWEHDLPREMLYQLSIYALAQGSGGHAAILYPTLNPLATDAQVDLRPYGGGVSHVVLRPVNMVALDDSLADQSVSGHRKRRALAEGWVRMGK
jgi:5-methylcytosine-specific restriction enzyme subunit McrC